MTPAGDRRVGKAGQWLARFAVLLLVSGARMGAWAARKPPPVKPEVRIPVDPLGYMEPGMLPEFSFHALVELEFVDASRLLFVFNRQETLLRRDDKCDLPNAQQRMVRAMVLNLPSGKVERQTDWELYDLRNFLWGVGGGQFLLRRCSRFDRVDASLEPKPLIDVSGEVKEVGFSPDRSTMVMEEAQPPNPATGKSAQKVSPPVGPKDVPAEKVDVEFIQLAPLRVRARSEIPVVAPIPIVGDGILEALPGPHGRWVVVFQPFAGPERRVVAFDSYCRPGLTPLSGQVFVAMMCPRADEMEYMGFNLSGGHMWNIPFTSDRLLPRFLLTRDGAHFALETLHLTHPHAVLDPLTSEGVDGEVLDVYDTNTGAEIGSLWIAPVYTAGKNAAFSPDGTRIAVLNNGAIEIYKLSDLAGRR